MDFIIGYIKSSLLGIIIGMILLIISILFLPESITYKIFTTLKPRILFRIKKYFKAITRLLIYNEYNDGDQEEKLQSVQEFKEKLKNYEEAYFLIDSIDNLFDILSFAVQDYNSEIYEQVTMYFSAYCDKLRKINDRKVFTSIQAAFEELEENLYEINEEFSNGGVEDASQNFRFTKKKKAAIQLCAEKISDMKQDIEKKIKMCKSEICSKAGELIEDMHL